MSQADFTAVIDRFSAAVAGLLPSAPPEAIAQLARATGDLLMAVSHQAAVMAAGTITPLVERQERQAARLDALDRRLNGVRSVAGDVQHNLDAYKDFQAREQLEPKERDKLIGIIYQHSTQVSDLERRISALEQRGGDVSSTT